MKGSTGIADVGSVKGSPLLILALVITLVPAYLLGSAAGAGPASILAGFIATFSTLALMGGALRPDLRLALWLVPLLLLASAVPRLLAEISRPAAAVMVAVLIFSTSLLPLWGTRLNNVGFGVGMVTLFGYGTAFTSAVSPWQLVVAALSGTGFAVALRVMIGVADPSKDTRHALADVIDGEGGELNVAVALDKWAVDGRQRWLGDALAAAVRYRLALSSADALNRLEPSQRGESALGEVRDRAAQLADQLRTKNPRIAARESEVDTDPAELASSGPVCGYLAAAQDALHELENALVERDHSKVQPTSSEHTFRREALRPAVRLRSVQLRHALRTALGVSIVLIATTYLSPDDPLVATALLTVFGILQASWRESVAKAVPRVVGVFVGAAILALAVSIVPVSGLPALALVALLIALWNMTARPAVAFAALVVVTVGLNTSTRNLDPVALLVEYAGLTVFAVVVGLVVGFSAVPALRVSPLRDRVLTAREATLAAVHALRAPVDELRFGALSRDAATARADLFPDGEPLDKGEMERLDRIRTSLAELSVLSPALALGSSEGPTRLGAVVDAANDLCSGVGINETPTADAAFDLGVVITGLLREIDVDIEHLLTELSE